MARSSYQEFTLDPKQTWNTGVPATSATGTTLSGWWGRAIRGSRRPGRGGPPRRRRRVRAELDPLVLAPLAGQEPAGLVVGGEDRGGPAELGDHVAHGGPAGDGQAGHPGPVNSKMRLRPPLTVYSRISHRIRSLEATQGGSSLQVHADHDRGRGLERVAGHGQGDLEPAGADGDRPAGARGRGVRVGPEQGRAGAGEPLGVDLVADAVAGPRVVEAVAGGAALEEQVVVGVAVVEAEHVVVDVLDGQVDPDPVQPQGLELHAGHRPGGVLEQRLVDPQGDLLPASSRPETRWSSRIFPVIVPRIG